MQKLLLASTLAVFTISAHAAPTVYGRIYTALDYVEDGDVEFNTYSSRIGFKGSEGLTPTVDINYKLEYGIKPDGDRVDQNVFTQRDTWLGLEHKNLGEIRVGRQYTPDDDVLYAIPSDYYRSGWQDGEWGARMSDSVKYISPTKNGLTFLVEAKIEDDGDVESKDAKGVLLFDVQGRQIYDKVVEQGSYSAALDYASETLPLVLGVSYTDYKYDSAKRDVDNTDNAFSISGEYTIDDKYTIGAGYQAKDYVNDSKETVDNYILSASYMATPKAFTYIEYDFSTNVNGVDGRDESTVSTGIWYDHTETFASWAGIGYTDFATEEDKFGITTGLRLNF